jgi:hypothetical protein
VSPEGSARSAAEDHRPDRHPHRPSQSVFHHVSPEASARSAAEDHRPDRQSTGEREQRAQRR